MNFNTTDLKFVFSEFPSDVFKSEEVKHIGLLSAGLLTLLRSFRTSARLTLGPLLCVRERRGLADETEPWSPQAAVLPFTVVLLDEKGVRG